MNQPMVSFEQVTFKYTAQKYPTLHDITFEIHAGEKILIVGASGSGKSTLGNCLNGLIPFSYAGELTGMITINGQDVAPLSLFDRSKLIGTVLQDTDAQFVGLSAGEDIAFSLENDALTNVEMKQRVHQISTRFEIEHLLHQKPQSLSGGQKQRTTMAGVIVQPIDILLFDEPLANLDPAAGKSTIELIDELHQEGHTVIIIEHRIEDVLHRPVDRMFVMDKGRLVAVDTPREILRQGILPLHGLREPLYVALLRYAGVPFTAQLLLEDINQICQSDLSLISDWFQQQPKVQVTTQQLPLLQLEDVSFSYDHNLHTLEDISFTIHQGEMISIVGKNGAGKTTLSKLICGFEPLKQGRIVFQGRDIATDSIQERAQSIGYVMQNPNHMITKQFVVDEVALGLQLRGMDPALIQSKVDEILAICGITRYKSWPISALSYGEKKRVTIASMLVLDPMVLILDEPTAGQDFKHYTEIMGFLRQLNEVYHYTIILITHDMHLMLEYAKRALVLSEGTLIADMPTSDVLTSLEITQQASLKETSLYHLAKALTIEPSALVQTFVAYEQEVRDAV
jgi:energy-coupling factor transport system ATP-binding protein